MSLNVHLESFLTYIQRSVQLTLFQSVNHASNKNDRGAETAGLSTLNNKTDRFWGRLGVHSREKKSLLLPWKVSQISGFTTWKRMVVNIKLPLCWYESSSSHTFTLWLTSPFSLPSFVTFAFFFFLFILKILDLLFIFFLSEIFIPLSMFGTSYIPNKWKNASLSLL